MSSHGRDEYRHNHYVPQWYQRRFIPQGKKQKELFRLKLRPQAVTGADGIQRVEASVCPKPPKKLFVQKDLYTTEIGGITNTEIEKFFFGKIDDFGKRAISRLCELQPRSSEIPDFTDLLTFLCTQRLRTPKGLAWLEKQTATRKKNELLYLLQRYQRVFGAIWSEAIWQIVDASNSSTKFIVSDHPVTVYNRQCPPGSPQCGEVEDPDIRRTGTHTIYPLSLEKTLILTNLSWVRNPYESAVAFRPNPKLHRDAVFMWTHIQTNRLLEEEEVVRMNYIIKSRAVDQIAAANPEWLYPERRLTDIQWDTFGSKYLLMPDPRLIHLGGQILLGFKEGGSTGYDEYGRRPWDRDYKDEKRATSEQRTFQRFQGEYSRLFGRKLRGQTLEFWGGGKEQISEELHRSYLAQEVGAEVPPKAESNENTSERPKT